jgi:hypothetical protein
MLRAFEPIDEGHIFEAVSFSISIFIILYLSFIKTFVKNLITRKTRHDNKTQYNAMCLTDRQATDREAGRRAETGRTDDRQIDRIGQS